MRSSNLSHALREDAAHAAPEPEAQTTLERRDESVVTSETVEIIEQANDYSSE
jgi:hypothetical protein